MKAINYKGNFDNTYIPHILKEIYIDKIYKNYLPFIKGGTVVDIGMNIGIFSLFAENAGAKKVQGYEPSSWHLETILMNIEGNQLEKVSVFQKAVSNKVGELELHHNQNTTMFSLSELVDDKQHPTEKVEVITMKEVLENAGGHINFLKLDPEGEEFKIVASPEFEEASKHIDALVVELHAWANVPYPNMIRMLEDYGYKVEQLPTDATCLGARRV